MAFEISGIEDPALKNAVNRLNILVKGDDKITSVEARKIYNAGSENIIKAIQPYGYFRAKVKSVSLTYTAGRWLATYAVYPGKQLKITRVTIKVTGPGKSNKAILKALKKSRKKYLKVGNVFESPKYQEARDKLMFEAQKEGYIRAKMDLDKVKINMLAYTCRVNLIMNTKHRYYFGATKIEKNPLKESFIRRFLNYKQGQAFSSDKLLNLQTSLSGAGYYKNVGVKPLLNRIKGYKVPIHINLTKNKRKLYQFGVGYGTVSGPRVTAGINWRWTNSNGNKFNTNMTLSQINQNVQAQYIIPAKNPATDQYVISGGLFTLQPGRGTAFVKKIGVGYQSQRGNWKRTLNLSYFLERYRITKNDPTKYARMLMPTATFEWTDVKDVIQVNNGSRLSFIAQGTYKPLGSSVSFLQGQARFKTIHTFFKDNRLIFRTDIGYTLVQNSNDLPLSIRFYTGGPSSVRGYSDQGIGPGRYLTVYSLEYQRRIVGNFYGALFYDIGNAFNSYKNYTSNLRRGAGFGAVYRSPIGDISVYLAKALTSKGQPIRFLFSLGAEL